MTNQRLKAQLVTTVIGCLISPSTFAANSCPAPWSASATYASPGNLVSENALVYRNNWWTQGDEPATHNGVYPGSGQPWTNVGACGSCVSAPPAPTGLAASGTTSAATTLSWSAVTVPSCVVTGYKVYKNGALLGTVTGASVAVSNLSPATSYSFAVAAVDAAGDSPQSSPITVTTQSASGGGGGGSTGGSSQSSGTINFHLWLGVNTAQDSLTLTGGNFDDLIASNVIAGVMYSHLVKEGFPGVQFNNDYLIGSIFAQLLQENIETQLYTSSSDLIDPSPLQQAVMGVGQGGPYQINNYAADMVSGSYNPDGHSLINYVAIQKNIGFTIANAAQQHTLSTPGSFNNKYYGPMLPAFFHYNDLVALNVTGKGAGGWVTPWEPDFDNALIRFKTLPNSFLEVIANAAYNQGFYGPLVSRYSKLGASATAATVASVNSYASVWGSTDTYAQYPYQVHYYLDQLYGNPIPTTSPTAVVTPQNHVVISMSALANVFSKVVQTLDYSNGTAPAQMFTANQAAAAFTSSLTKNAVSTTASLDLSNASSRAVMFAVIDNALSNLETAVGMKFNATTLSQL
ncbi:fibronectin type III domain-containing protein [Methylocystis sp. Sn-Cys]|uniref:fibronectin type III domain-containing protein n=1 Tax=Methylocystis sp. Sn-Cys TaxID=1701263 RepID=UPI001920A1A8|nr:fibronectin type III domain-containing protein [Methylocystis sp. Sn-Cys]MBL1256361.1 fibronectin type III domain-containing protein [Methylocystis sp. Sn-Cys]